MSMDLSVTLGYGKNTWMKSRPLSPHDTVFEIDDNHYGYARRFARRMELNTFLLNPIITALHWASVFGLVYLATKDDRLFSMDNLGVLRSQWEPDPVSNQTTTLFFGLNRMVYMQENSSYNLFRSDRFSYNVFPYEDCTDSGNAFMSKEACQECASAGSSTSTWLMFMLVLYSVWLYVPAIILLCIGLTQGKGEDQFKKGPVKAIRYLFLLWSAVDYLQHDVTPSKRCDNSEDEHEDEDITEPDDDSLLNWTMWNHDTPPLRFIRFCHIALPFINFLVIVIGMSSFDDCLGLIEDRLTGYETSLGGGKIIILYVVAPLLALIVIWKFLTAHFSFLSMKWRKNVLQMALDMGKDEYHKFRNKQDERRLYLAHTWWEEEAAKRAKGVPPISRFWQDYEYYPEWVEEYEKRVSKQEEIEDLEMQQERERTMDMGDIRVCIASERGISPPIAHAPAADPPKCKNGHAMIISDYHGKGYSSFTCDKCRKCSNAQGVSHVRWFCPEVLEEKCSGGSDYCFDCVPPIVSAHDREVLQLSTHGFPVAFGKWSGKQTLYCGRKTNPLRTTRNPHIYEFCGTGYGNNCDACRACKAPSKNCEGAVVAWGTLDDYKRTLYCGRKLGEDGQCGPNEGPQCKACRSLPGQIEEEKRRERRKVGR